MSVAATFAMAVVGGVGAKYLDKKFPDKKVSLGPVDLQPGALGAIAIFGALALRVPLPGRAYLGGLATGAAIVEGTELAESTDVVAKLEKLLGMSPSGASAGYDMREFPGAYGDLDYELSSSLYDLRAA